MALTSVSTWTVLATTKFLLDVTNHQGNNERDNSLLERNDKANALNMDKDGVFFMAPWPNLLKRRISSNTAIPKRKTFHGSSWKLQRLLLSSLPKSSLRPILLPQEDDDDDDDAEENDNRISALRQSKTTTKYKDHPLWIDNFGPSTLKSTDMQPRSVSACDHVLTVGSASAVECIRMPPDPSLGSNHQHGPDSCA
jgi:hypothetical protein